MSSLVVLYTGEAQAKIQIHNFSHFQILTTGFELTGFQK